MAFLGALTFLTRIPLRLRRPPELTAAVAWFAVVGALVGALVGGVAAGLGELVPAFVAGTVAVLVGVLTTGAFHEDGLADVADAFAGGWTPEQRLTILDDPRHGTYGVAALAGSLVLRAGTLASLVSVGPAVAFAGAVTAHTVARASAVGLMAFLPTARRDGLGVDYVHDLARTRVAAAVLSGLAIGGAATGWWIVPVAAAGIVAAACTGWLAMRKIGGISGDVLGATEQVAECLALVVVSGLAPHHQLWWG